MIKLFDTSALLSIIYEAQFAEALLMAVNEGHSILIPKEVYTEIKDVTIIAELLRNEKIDLLPSANTVNIEKIKSRHVSLHDGEISTLIRAQELNQQGIQCRCIIDERDATKYAKSNNITVNGVIGFFLWLKNKEKINKEQCQKIYDGLAHNPRLPKELLRCLIDDNRNKN